MTPAPQKKSPLGDATTGAVEGFDAPPRVLVFRGNVNLQGGATETRRRWAGGVVIDHEHPAERALASGAKAAFLLVLITLFFRGSRDPLPLAFPLAYGASALLLAAAARLVDVYWVASPADQELLEVAGLGPWHRVLRRIPLRAVQGLRLADWKGYVVHKSKNSPPRKVPFHVRRLEYVNRNGKAHPLTYAEEAGPGNERCMRAVAELLGVDWELEPSKDLGRMAGLPAQPPWWVDVAGGALGIAMGAALAGLYLLL